MKIFEPAAPAECIMVGLGSEQVRVRGMCWEDGIGAFPQFLLQVIDGRCNILVSTLCNGNDSRANAEAAVINNSLYYWQAFPSRFEQQLNSCKEDGCKYFPIPFRP